MEQNQKENVLEEINRKLDVILAEIELQRRHRREMEDFKEDLMRVLRDLYSNAIVELEQVHDYIRTGDIFHFFKKILRNLNNLSSLFDQIESIRDAMKDLAPITRETSIKLMYKLDELDRKGYFSFFKELRNILDKIVTSFTVEDVKALGDNIVTILNTIKNLTQPDMLQSINNAVSVYKNLDVKVEHDVSLMKLLKELNQPETKKALYFAIEFLKNLSSSNNTNNLQNIQIK
ncbi:MAG: DUF1641 domain-containing protein [Ignavibacteria bacterium]|nr:DUF1641 domain-containing protein [Ignavibacteria bacterium]